MKTVITYGTFDVFHIGHLNLLEAAKRLGERLIVAVSTDEFNARKGKKALMPYEHRKRIVESLRFVDIVIPETNWEQKVIDVLDHNVDVFCIGDDWLGKFDFLRRHCDVVYLPRTRGIDSTSIRSLVESFDGKMVKQPEFRADNVGVVRKHSELSL